MLFLEFSTFAFTLWLGLYLLARNPASHLGDLSRLAASPLTRLPLVAPASPRAGQAATPSTVPPLTLKDAKFNYAG